MTRDELLVEAEKAMKARDFLQVTAALHPEEADRVYKQLADLVPDLVAEIKASQQPREKRYERLVKAAKECVVSAGETTTLIDVKRALEALGESVIEGPKEREALGCPECQNVSVYITADGKYTCNMCGWKSLSTVDGHD